MSVQNSVTAAPAIAFAGMLADGSAINNAITLKNADAVSMPFGAIVAAKTSAPDAGGKDAILPAASTARLLGVLLHKHNYERTFQLPDGSTVGELDAVGLTVGTTFSCLRTGTVYVTCEDGCNVGDGLWVRYAGGTLGAARATDAGGSTCIDATAKCEWLSITAAGQVGKLSINFSGK